MPKLDNIPQTQEIRVTLTLEANTALDTSEIQKRLLQFLPNMLADDMELMKIQVEEEHAIYNPEEYEIAVAQKGHLNQEPRNPTHGGAYGR